MKATTKSIADDYYINGLTNAKIFEKHGLERRKSNIVQERVFEHMPPYLHPTLRCEYCGEKMESFYLGKNVKLADEDLLIRGSKELQNIDLVRVEDSQVKRSWRDRAGSAYLVETNYRVSSPVCTGCGHQLKSTCGCDSCDSAKNENSIRAAAIAYAELAALEKIDIDDLSCSQMLPIFQQLSDLIDKAVYTNSQATFEDLNFEPKVTLILLNVAEVSWESVLPAIRMISKTKYTIEWEKIIFKIRDSNELVDVISNLKLRALDSINSQTGSLDTLEVWESLAQEEALNVLEHYCRAHDIHCSPSDQTIAAIKRSLNRYGLAQTARYVCKAVRRAASYASENNYNRYRAFTLIYGNLNFWIDDPRARNYNAPPFNRTENLLSEPISVSVFSRFFLERNEISYFSDPISMRSLVKQASLGNIE